VHQSKEMMRSSFHNFDKPSLLKNSNASPMNAMTGSTNLSSPDKKKNLPSLKGPRLEDI
jgi:hypothetical protein